MIDKTKVDLAQALLVVKQGNLPLYHAICRGLQAIADPEHERFVKCSKDMLEGCQGRVQMITEVLEVFFRCEEIATSVPRETVRSPPQVAKGVFNG